MDDLTRKLKETQELTSVAVQELKTSIENLSLAVKYLLFDLEATRRENEVLREQVQKNLSDENDNPKP